MHWLWAVLLGPRHSLTLRYHAFHDQLVQREKFLKTVDPSNPGPRYLVVPALVGHWLQLRTNLWLPAQAKIPAPLTPVDFTKLLDQRTLQACWEPSWFPLHPSLQSIV
mmetsp:Transcript_55518/g.109607  ORF Transcript_55518/g.109607 Transcript_55518/m.109607 type:complete len:108 (+) Transcript_55518:136-459(+)